MKQCLSSGAKQPDEARGRGGRREEEVAKQMSQSGREVCDAQFREGATCAVLKSFSFKPNQERRSGKAGGGAVPCEK